MFETEAQGADRQPGSARKWRIAHKLTTASVLMILLTLLAGGVGVWQVFAIGQAVSDVREKEQQLDWSLELLAAGHRLIAALDRMLLIQDPLLASTELPVSLGTLKFYMGILQESGGGVEAADLLEEIQITYDELLWAVDEVNVLVRQDLWTEASIALEQDVRPVNKHMRLLIRRLVRRTDQDVEAVALHAQAVVWQAASLLSILLVLTTAIALGWRRFVFRGMALSITELRQGVARISSGDLEYKLDVRTGDEIEELGDEFNKMADELAGLIGSLEQQVAERTADLARRAVQLQAAAEVAREAAAIRDVDQLLDEAVRLISDLFGFYHAGVFLVDDKREYAVLRAASSEGGRRMLDRGHKLAVGKVGMVGYVTGIGEPRIALDVGEDAVHFVNPDLPQTRSEMALPLRARGEVIGALDVQSAGEAAFTDEDAAVLQTMADQLAVAVENARLFEQAETNLRELDALYRLHTQEEWEQLTREHVMTTAYRYSPVGISPAEEAQWPEIGGAVQRGEAVVLSDDGAEFMTTPMTLRGQTIGVLGFRRPAGAEPWSAQDVALTEATASQVALALENARLFQEARRRTGELALINRVISAAISFPDLRETLDAVAAELIDVFSLGHVGIALLNEERTALTVVADSSSASDDQDAMGVVLPLEGNVSSQQVIATRQPLVISDAQNNPLTASIHEVMRWRGTQTLLILPLIAGNQVVGTFGLDILEADRTFTSEEMRLAETIVAQVSTVVQNARLFEQVQATLAETDALYRASRDIVVARTSDDVLRAFTGHIVAPELGRCILALIDPTSPPEEPVVEVKAAWEPGGARPAILGDRWAVSQIPLIAGMAAEPVVISDVATLPEMDEVSRHVFLNVLDIKAAAIIPLFAGGRRLGWLLVESLEGPYDFGEREVRLYRALAGQAAMALERIRLLEETERRATQLAAAAEVARDATAILDVDQLLHETVYLISEQFGFYHAGVFLVDDKRDYAILRAVSSEGGKRMLARGHKLEVGKVGMVGYVTDTGKPRIALDVGKDAVHFVNPDLPETRSEMTLPLQVRGEVIGALDVQSTEEVAFTDEDVAVLQTMADQLANAIENARLFGEIEQTAERLKEVDRLKSQFLANMSHELRTPLNSIIGFSRVILKGIDGPLTDLQCTDLQAIYESGLHLLGLINDILDISKIEAGKMELAFESVDLHEVIKGVMSTAVALVKDKPIELQHSIAPRLPMVRGDARRIRQVLLNLISNATKFTEEGFVRLAAEATPSEVVLSVADSGIGIPPEKIGEIFEPFTQVDASSTRRAGGTGLGLSISKRFVDLHSGRIWVESTPGEGSTFYFTLPIEQNSLPLVDEGPEEELEQPEPGSDRKLVLCVDDDAGVITLFRRYLSKQGYQVVGLTDSTAVVERARRLEPFAITLDVLMPDKDGWQVVQELKADPETCQIPIVICTIVSNEKQRPGLGVSDYLVKPIMEQELLAALNRLGQETDRHQVSVVDD
ncbi:MAG: GAF domain-containing protein [Chloroflexota bacterium]|nr:GAF domain-containing protein [Chloroflexota bacterium]